MAQSLMARAQNRAWCGSLDVGYGPNSAEFCSEAKLRDVPEAAMRCQYSQRVSVRILVPNGTDHGITDPLDQVRAFFPNLLEQHLSPYGPFLLG